MTRSPCVGTMVLRHHTIVTESLSLLFTDCCANLCHFVADFMVWAGIAPRTGWSSLGNDNISSMWGGRHLLWPCAGHTAPVDPLSLPLDHLHMSAIPTASSSTPKPLSASRNESPSLVECNRVAHPCTAASLSLSILPYTIPSQPVKLPLPTRPLNLDIVPGLQRLV